MSYWYKRFSKKYVVVFLLTIPILLGNGLAQVVASYIPGCIATLSRTLWDWVTVDSADGIFEIHPYAYIPLEEGCIEWLGFSSCEPVQFKEFMEIFSDPEDIELTIFNYSTSDSVPGPESIPTLINGPFSLRKGFADDGSSAVPGKLSIRQRSVLLFDSSRSQELFVLPDLRAVSQAASSRGTESLKFISLTVGALLGISESPNPLNIALYEKSLHDEVVISTPHAFSLYREKRFGYILSLDSAKGCRADVDCQPQCAYSIACEPLKYGFHGILLPSASFLGELTNFLLLSDLPRVSWNFGKFRPDQSTKFAPSIQIFSPEMFVARAFENNGPATLERFPHTDFYEWKASSLTQRREGCNGGVNLGSKGKDCNVPEQFVSIGFLWPTSYPLFLSTPLPSQSDVQSNVFSERVTGLRFAFSNVWQMNVRIPKQVFTGFEDNTFLPLFWTSGRPGLAGPALVKIRARFGEDLQMTLLQWAEQLVLYMWVAWMLYILSYVAMLYLLMYALTCCDYMKAITKANPDPDLVGDL